MPSSKWKACVYNSHCVHSPKKANKPEGQNAVLTKTCNRGVSFVTFEFHSLDLQLLSDRCGFLMKLIILTQQHHHQ